MSFPKASERSAFENDTRPDVWMCGSTSKSVGFDLGHMSCPSSSPIQMTRHGLCRATNAWKALINTSGVVMANA